MITQVETECRWRMKRFPGNGFWSAGSAKIWPSLRVQAVRPTIS